MWQLRKKPVIIPFIPMRLYPGWAPVTTLDGLIIVTVWGVPQTNLDGTVVEAIKLNRNLANCPRMKSCLKPSCEAQDCFERERRELEASVSAYLLGSSPFLHSFFTLRPFSFARLLVSSFDLFFLLFSITFFLLFLISENIRHSLHPYHPHKSLARSCQKLPTWWFMDDWTDSKSLTVLESLVRDLGHQYHAPPTTV